MTHQVSNSEGRKNHVYVFIRRDLPFSQQVVQACHAAIEAATLISSDLAHPYLVVCGIRNEPHLQKALSRLQQEGVVCRPFIESDIGNQLTAFATEPIFSDRRHIFRRYNCLPGFVQGESNNNLTQTPSTDHAAHSCAPNGAAEGVFVSKENENV